MAERKKIFEKDIIDKKLILPSFINKNYLEQKFNDLKENKKEELNNDFNPNKIIIENKKLTIFEIDTAKNLENKIYESDDFTEVIKKLTKFEIEENNFNFALIKNMKNGIFIIESEDIVIYGAFFFLKCNKSERNIEIISEEENRQIQFITEYSNGNFAYNSYIARPLCTEDTFYVFDVNKNEKCFIKSFNEYDGIYDSKFSSLTNGFAFNNFFCFNENNKNSYLNIVEGINLKRYIINFIGDIRQLISDDKYIYLLSKKTDNSVYIFNIENKKFYSKYFKIWSKIKEPEEIVFDESKVKSKSGNENSKEKNNSYKKKKKCIIF